MHREKVEATTTSATWRMSSATESRAGRSPRSGTICSWKVSNASAIKASLSGQWRYSVDLATPARAATDSIRTCPKPASASSSTAACRIAMRERSMRGSTAWSILSYETLTYRCETYTFYRMATVSVRYIVDDVDAAIDFYCGQLEFHEVMHPAPSFAMLSHGDLRLVLTAPGGGPGGGQAMPDGTLPAPGGWNRFQLEVDDLEAIVARLRDHGARFRNEIVAGVGGKQILVEDPAGNPVELL